MRKGKNLYLYFILKIDLIVFKWKSINYALIKRNLSSRISSFPFLSPDTYLCLTDFGITNTNQLQDWLNNYEKYIGKNIYIVSNLIEELNKEIIFRVNPNAKFSSLTIGQDDELIGTSKVSNIMPFFNSIYSSNLSESVNSITPVPLGLERAAYKSSGIIRHFERKFSIDAQKRIWDVVVCWNDQTNSNRFNLKNKFRDRENILVIDKRISSYTLHKIYRKTLFVPSPAGNGLDCHRTWEALYLGAVPVVLESEFTGDDSWPVVRVNSWEDFLSLKHDELIKLYDKNARTQEQMIDFSLNILEKISGKKLRAVL